MFYENRKADMTLGVRPTGTGHLTAHPHLHYHLELVWMYEGNSRAILDTVEHDMPEDSLFLAFPNQLHSYASYEDEGYMLLIINPDSMPELAPLFDRKWPEDPVLTSVSSYPKLRALLEILRLEHDASGDKLSSTMLHGLTLALFSELFRHMKLSDRIQGDLPALREIISYCARHFDEELTLTVLAEELHLSKFYISHIFSNQFKMTFTDYVNSLRSTAACRYLCNTDKSITEISELVGFGTTRTFNRAFLKQFGKTPSNYRTQNAQVLAGRS
jgi:AraC-like DNA-binding protein